MKQPATLVGAVAAIVSSPTRRGSGPRPRLPAIVPLAVFPIRYVGKKLVTRRHQLQAQSGRSPTGSPRTSPRPGRCGLSASRSARGRGASRPPERAAGPGQIKVAKYAQALTPAIEIISAIGISITFVYAYRWNVHSGSFLAILTALYISYEPIKKLGALNNELKRGSAALHRLEYVFNEPVIDHRSRRAR